jgi:hypothetical protein
MKLKSGAQMGKVGTREVDVVRGTVEKRAKEAKMGRVRPTEPTRGPTRIKRWRGGRWGGGGVVGRGAAAVAAAAGVVCSIAKGEANGGSGHGRSQRTPHTNPKDLKVVDESTKQQDHGGNDEGRRRRHGATDGGATGEMLMRTPARDRRGEGTKKLMAPRAKKQQKEKETKKEKEDRE